MIQIHRALALIALLVFPCLADESSITVTGESKVTVKPDIAYLTLYVRGEGILMTDAAKMAEDKINQLKSKLLAKSTNIQLIEIVDISIGEKQSNQWRPDQKDEMPRPEIVKRLRISLPPDQKLIFETIDIAIRSGALMQNSSITRPFNESGSLVAYSITKHSDYQEKAAMMAVEDAKARALKAAKIAGKGLGELLRITCSDDVSTELSFRGITTQSDYPTKYVSNNPDKLIISHSFHATFLLLSKN